MLEFFTKGSHIPRVEEGKQWFMPFECNISSVEVQVELRVKVKVQVVLERLEAVIFMMNPIPTLSTVLMT